MRVGEAWRFLERLTVGRTDNRAAQSKGAFLVKGVHDALAKVIEVHPGARADTGFGVGCVDNRKAGSEVGLLFGPIAGLVVDLSTGGKGERILEDLPLSRSLAALDKPRVRIHCGRNLLAIGFVRRLKNRVPHSKGNREVGLDPPGVLKEVFELVGLEMAIDEGSVRQESAG